MLLTLMFGANSLFMGLEADHARYQTHIDVDSVRNVHIMIPFRDPALEHYTGERAQNRALYLETIRERREAARIRARQQSLSRSKGGMILAGILDLPRLPQTGPIDGCQKIHKGLTNSGGFLLFTCEKLIPSVNVAEHRPVAKRYASELIKAGWRQTEAPDKNTRLFASRDENGCDRSLKMMTWTDRSINEERPLNPKRDDFRQIVFLTQFSGEPCERYYPIVKALAK